MEALLPACRKGSLRPAMATEASLRFARQPKAAKALASADHAAGFVRPTTFPLAAPRGLGDHRSAREQLELNGDAHGLERGVLTETKAEAALRR